MQFYTKTYRKDYRLAAGNRQLSGQPECEELSPFARAQTQERAWRVAVAGGVWRLHVDASLLHALFTTSAWVRVRESKEERECSLARYLTYHISAEAQQALHEGGAVGLDGQSPRQRVARIHGVWRQVAHAGLVREKLL